MKLVDFEKIGTILGRQHKVQIIAGDTWAANIKERKIFFRKEDIYTLAEEHILGLLLHETAHIHYTTTAIVPPQNEEIVHSTLNMLEDISIEHIIAGDYPNAGEILESTKVELLDTLIKMLPKMDHVSLYEKSLLYAAIRFEGRGYATGTEIYEKVGDEISSIMTQRSSEIYERKKTSDLLSMTLEIVDILIKHLGQPDAKNKDQMKRNNQQGNATKETSQDPAKRQLIKKLQGGKGWGGGIDLKTEITFIDTIADQASMIGKRLRSVLKRNNSMEFGGRYRTGKLLAKRLTRIKVTKDRRPFARRIVKSNQSYAFAIASDVSGSMFKGGGEDPASYALSSMYMVAEALRVAGIPRSMILFGKHAKVASRISKNPIRWEDLVNEKIIHSSGQGDTNIHHAIDACTKELKTSRAERKIMIILTDGSSDRHQMKRAHKDATDADIECLGITIGNDSSEMDNVFSEKKNTHIEDTHDTAKIGKAFVDILKESVAHSPQ